MSSVCVFNTLWSAGLFIFYGNFTRPFLYNFGKINHAWPANCWCSISKDWESKLVDKDLPLNQLSNNLYSGRHSLQLPLAGPKTQNKMGSAQNWFSLDLDFKNYSHYEQEMRYSSKIQRTKTHLWPKPKLFFQCLSNAGHLPSDPNNNGDHRLSQTFFSIFSSETVWKMMLFSLVKNLGARRLCDYPQWGSSAVCNDYYFEYIFGPWKMLPSRDQKQEEENSL